MHRPACSFVLWLALSATPVTVMATQVDYDFESKVSNAAEPGRRSGGRVSIEMDGARFTIRSARGTTEHSNDDGATTWFGDDPSKMQTPLLPPSASALAPIASRPEDESLTVSPATPGPLLLAWVCP